MAEAEGGATARPASEWPVLRPEERASSYVDYASAVPNYRELVAAEGEAGARESLDYLFYFLNTSHVLAAEPEFAGLAWELDPHDFLVYELCSYAAALGGPGLEGLGPALSAPRVQHMIAEGLERYYTPALCADVERRAGELARRRAGTVDAAQAEAVAMAAASCMTPLAVGLLVESFRVALVRAALDLPGRLERQWEERDRGLDRWLEALRRARFERPAEEAAHQLARAGQAALPHAAQLCGDAAYGCDDYPYQAALGVVAAIPSPQSLWLLAQALSDCPTLSGWAAMRLAAAMPALACRYFHYLLAAPQAAPAWAAAACLGALATARCRGAVELARESLHYEAEDAELTETVQVAAWEALLALDDPVAIPHLREYLASDRANPAARDQLVEALRRESRPGWWDEVLASARTGQDPGR